MARLIDDLLENLKRQHFVGVKKSLGIGNSSGVFALTESGRNLAREYLARVGGPRGEFYHAAFRLDPVALDQYAAALRERGTEVRGPVTFATGRRSYFVEDPDEHTFELTDR